MRPTFGESRNDAVDRAIVGYKFSVRSIGALQKATVIIDLSQQRIERRRELRDHAA